MSDPATQSICRQRVRQGLIALAGVSRWDHRRVIIAQDIADDLNAEALADVLRDGPQLPEATVRHLVLAGHRLRP
jgi:hypothetical protein